MNNFSLYGLVLLAITLGCHPGMMVAHSKYDEAFINSFIREDGSTMYFVKKLEWKSVQSDDLITGDITLYTSPEMKDSCLIHLSWMTSNQECDGSVAVQLASDTTIWIAEKMYSDAWKRHYLHRFEWHASTRQVFGWLSQANAVIHFMQQDWTLTKAGGKSRQAALDSAFNHWEMCNQEMDNE